MRLALEDLLRVPDEAPEVDGQLHARLTTLPNLVAQHPQILLQLQMTHALAHVNLTQSEADYQRTHVLSVPGD